MRVLLFTSVSSKIAGIAGLTIPNKSAYCMRHGYSLVIDNRPYEEAVAATRDLARLLDTYDLVWSLDADAVITDMHQRIEELACLGPHATVCEEGIVPWNVINCGSMVWRSTDATKQLLHAIAGSRSEWAGMPCIWQTWLQVHRGSLGDALTVAPLRAFNSCVWNKPGGGEGEPGSHWQPGDFVYHPCGVFPLEERERWIVNALRQVNW